MIKADDDDQNLLRLPADRLPEVLAWCEANVGPLKYYTTNAQGREQGGRGWRVRIWRRTRGYFTLEITDSNMVTLAALKFS